MMSMFYFWMLLVGSAMIWATWTFLIQDLFLDVFRSVLFECRADLIALVDSGEIRYDDPAYASIRSVINGLIRYGHKITFGLYLISSVHAAHKVGKPDEANIGQQIALRISRHNPHARDKMIEIYSRVHRACICFMFARSFALQCFFIIWLLAKPFRRDDTARVKAELVNQVQKDVLTASEWDSSQTAFA